MVQSGFSLIEVLLALGVVSVAFLPLLGMLPVGMAASRSAMDETLASQIIQQIGNETQQSDFDKVTSTVSSRYFDNQLQELPEASGSIYQSRMAVITSPETPHVKRLVIQVVRNPDAAVELQETTLSDGTSKIWSETISVPLITRSLLLARSSSVPM